MFWITFEVLMPGDFDLDIYLQHVEDSRGFCLLQILINTVDNLVPVPSGIILILLLYNYNIVLLLIRRIVHFSTKKSFIMIYEAKIWCKIFKFVNLMSGVTVKFATCNLFPGNCKFMQNHNLPLAEFMTSCLLVCCFLECNREMERMDAHWSLLFYQPDGLLSCVTDRLSMRSSSCVLWVSRHLNSTC